MIVIETWGEISWCSLYSEGCNSIITESAKRLEFSDACKVKVTYLTEEFDIDYYEVKTQETRKNVWFGLLGSVPCKENSLVKVKTLKFVAEKVNVYFDGEFSQYLMSEPELLEEICHASD